MIVRIDEHLQGFTGNTLKTSLTNPMDTDTQGSRHFMFEQFSRDLLKQHPKSTYIDGWKIEYLAFSHPATQHLPPTIILGGAFQTFNSYKYWVEPMLSAGPVVFVDLPAMGSNDQTHNNLLNQPAEALSLTNLSDLFARWLTEVGIPQVSLMGMSLGSVVASIFATTYPQMMQKTILLGVMHETRPSWKMVIQESMKLLENGDMDRFAQAVLLFLINHTQIKKTKLSALAKKMFYAQMAGFSTNEKERYFINARRLLRMEAIPTPSCPVLVVSGEHDSFTLPFENSNYALLCQNMQFAVILNTDHLPQLERRKETMNLFIAFLKDEPIDQLDGVKTLGRDALSQLERRRESRIVVNQPYDLHNATSTHTIILNNIHYFGICIECHDEETARNIMQSNDYALKFHHTERTLDYPCMFFEQSGRTLRGIFKHDDFGRSDDLLQHLEQLKAEQLKVFTLSH